MEEKVLTLEKQASNLTEIIVNSRKKMFGKSSEQSKYIEIENQLTLFNEAEKETLVAAHKRRAKRTKKELTEDLKHIKEVIKLEEPVCEICGGELTPIGGGVCPQLSVVYPSLGAYESPYAYRGYLRVLKRNGQQTNSTSRMWVFCTDKDSAMKMSLYFYHPTRSGAVVKQVIGDYSDYLQTDGCASYNKAENAVHVGCWAHARRKWTDCREPERNRAAAGGFCRRQKF